MVDEVVIVEHIMVEDEILWWEWVGLVWLSILLGNYYGGYGGASYDINLLYIYDDNYYIDYPYYYQYNPYDLYNSKYLLYT